MEKLSNSESVIMKAVWGAGEQLSVLDLLDILEKDYGRSYKRTSIATFLLRLEVKGFVRSERVGKQAYVVTLISEQDYLAFVAKSDLDFWFDGDTLAYFSALNKGKPLTAEEKAKIKALLEEG